MNELVKVTKNAQGSQVVDARELWRALNVTREFSKWIGKHLVNSPYFAENEDYVVVANFGDNLKGGRKFIDYAITIDTAKKLAMTVDSDRGDEVRNYFLECEKKSSQLSLPSYQIEDPIERAKAWIGEQQKLQLAESKVEEAEEKINTLDKVVSAISDRATDMTITDVSKRLRISAIKLNDFLVSLGILFKNKKHAKSGYEDWFRESYFIDKYGKNRASLKVTNLGAKEIIKKYILHNPDTKLLN